MDGEKNRKKKSKRVGFLGRLLSRLPRNQPLLYPLYLAAQLDTVMEEYASPRVPQAFDGLTIAFLSDIHYGTLFKEDRVRSLVQRVNDLQADVVLLGGDYGENSDGAVEFFQLNPGFQAKIAVLAALGNHDRTLPDENYGKLRKAMFEAGVIRVSNGAYMLERDGQKLAFASTDDYFNGQPDLERVAKLCRPADFTVFFPHNPDILPLTYQLPDGPFYQLALCGHTHGGQVALFGRSIKYSSQTGRRYLSGWFHENGVDIRVSNGVGTSGIPVRLGARPQIHLITLKKAQ